MPMRELQTLVIKGVFNYSSQTKPFNNYNIIILQCNDYELKLCKIVQAYLFIEKSIFWIVIHTQLYINTTTFVVELTLSRSRFDFC